MTTHTYAIIDVETTGGGINGNRITEICIALYKEGSVIDKFTSLVNPQAFIPAFITGLTGIDNDMVANAPYFEDISDKVASMTQGAIFVAHNVNFDYRVIQGEFKRLGQQFIRKKLCTVRLSRKLIPNQSSYSLGNLCGALGIILNNRHRAEGDTDATVILFERLLSLDADFAVFEKFLNARSKEATLPPHLSVNLVDALPETAGVYFFKDQKGVVIYIGKAINIKKRVLSHFYDKKNKEFQLGQETYHIDYEETGNELCALLLESEQIQLHFPKYNRAQKLPVSTYGILAYENRKGILQLGINKTKFTTDTVEVLHNATSATERLTDLCEQYELCPRFCGLQSSMEKCSHYRITNCKGVCEDKENIIDYNLRVQKALDSMSTKNEHFVVTEKGRSPEELAFIVVKHGIYQGFGFIERSIQVSAMEDFETYLQLKKQTYHTSKILHTYLLKNTKRNVIDFPMIEVD